MKSVFEDQDDTNRRQFYWDNLKFSSAIETLIVADRYSYADLRQRTLAFVCEQFEKFYFTQIRKLNLQLFRELLENEELSAPEELIFDHLMEWSRVNAPERAQYMPDLLKLIQFDHIPSRFEKL